MPIHSRICGATPTPAPAPRLVPTPDVYRAGPSGTVWLITGPGDIKRNGTQLYSGTVVNLGARPQKSRHGVGYTTKRLSLHDMARYTGEVCIRAA